jgi:uncharacterized membrane protein
MTTQSETNDLEYANLANWHLKMIYASRKDSRIVVPKKSGFKGMTVNFAKPAGIMIHVFNVALLTMAVVYVYCTFLCK